MSVEPYQQLATIHTQTSLVDVTSKLPFKPPCKIMFKNEYEQPLGSFKLRGIGNLIKKSIEKSRHHDPTKKIHIFASSGGNAGLAAAYLANFYNVPCTVVLPNLSKIHVIEKLKSYNAEVIQFGETINEADKYLKTKMSLYDDNNYEKVYCHPFESQLTWEGHSTLVDEITLESKINPDKVKGMVCSIGGGGLYNGIFQGIENNKLNSDILLIETKQAPTFAETIKEKSIITLKSVKSVATSLACSYLSLQSLKNYLNQSLIKTFMESIDDLDAIKGSVQYYKHFNRIVEPACGAALSVAFEQLPLIYKHFGHLHEDDIIVVVVCGGSCTDEQGLIEFKDMVNRANKL